MREKTTEHDAMRPRAYHGRRKWSEGTDAAESCVAGFPTQGCGTSLEEVRSYAFSISNHIICLSLLTPLASGAELRGTPLVLKPVCSLEVSIIVSTL